MALIEGAVCGRWIESGQLRLPIQPCISPEAVLLCAALVKEDVSPRLVSSLDFSERGLGTRLVGWLGHTLYSVHGSCH